MTNKTEKLIDMKKTFALICAIMIFCCNGINANATNLEFSWYCIRNGNSQPPITSEEALISKYGGYAIDRSVDDEADKRILYLTFDAGYENGNIEKILNVLKEKHVCAAFFILDNIILKNSDLVTRMAEEGHLVCNHTKNHKNICALSKDEILNNLSSLETIYREKTGLTMTKYFRFPEGRYSVSALKTINELGYKSIFWSFAYDDWDNMHQCDPEYAFNKIISNTHNGAIILLHPTSKVNAEIMPKLIDKWRAEGYSFGSLDDLCI